ncbi:MAG: SEC-C metal-binding domain-containing protein, partial [Elusimicrobia bacterium]|nr:SEC-C metal-binding domain-containing protein [Elusimicrobiota bacterium]
LTIGISDAFAEFNEFRQATLQELEEKQKTHPILTEDEIPRLMHEIVVDRGWGDWQGSIIGRLFQEDLFDLQKTSGFSSNVLDALSWGVGEDLEFFSEGKFRGWPLRVWPVFKRPFLKINNHYYCFDLHGMYDHLYRALQRVILKNKPGYQETWNNKQKDISEKIPCDLLLRLLPGAQVYRNVFYPIQPEGGAPRQWGEVDAVLTYDDYLFVVEVKAGAFKLISPATDFPMYIRSLRDLVLTPAKQGERFLKYLASAEEVALFDSSHSEIKRVSYRDYRQNVILAVSLDPFTEYAAQVTHLKDIGVDVGASPVWSISVEDLTVYSDIFENPLVFLHFVEERLRASKSLQIKLDDELYHLGLYLKHNLYTEYAKQFNENEPMQWVGYAADIDRYYSRKASGIPDVHLPKQKTPKRIREINDILVKGTRPGRSRVVRALLNCDSYWREKIASGIDELLIEQARDMRPKSISTFVGEKISIYCWQEGVFDRNERFAIEHSQAAMIIRNDSERILIELFFDKNSSITDVCFKFLKLNSLSSFELEKVKELAESLKKARVSRERATTTIGRNDKCPCGSGRKYKKCCMDIC